VRARAETFGAWVRFDDRTLVALDRAAARRLGIDGKKRWRDPAPTSIADATDRPLEVHVAVTSRCPASCEGCYLDARADGSHRSFDDLATTLDAIAERGAFTVAFGGGEPLTHPDLPRLAAHARAVGLTPVVTTSGIGLTAEKARALSSFAQVNVSYDGVGETYETVRGFDGARIAERAITTLIAAGIGVGVNVVLTRQNFATLVELVERVVSLGAREIQLLRWKPAGRAASLDYLTRRLSQEQVAALPELVRELTTRTSVRIDCALVPLLSFGNVDDLLKLAVMGCEAGRALGAVDVRGNDAPCSFLSGVSLPKYEVPEPCASCPVRAVCRSGCRVVAKHLTGDVFAPDPECPRVIEARG
jgi:MoaA/NifB/PqqE/SkfB family radical SAM enzyme